MQVSVADQSKEAQAGKLMARSKEGWVDGFRSMFLRPELCVAIAPAAYFE